MSTVAKLIIEDQIERELSRVEMSYHRGATLSGKPSTEIMGGLITVVFPSQRDDDYFLEWLFKDRLDDGRTEDLHSLYTIKKGEIVFHEGSFDGVIIDRYRFEDCTPICWREEFSNQHGMVAIMTLSAAIQKYNFQLFVKRWNESWKPPTAYKPSIQEDVAPKVIDYYLTNKNGERIEKAQIGDIVYLNIETRNLIGHKISVDLDSPKVDYRLNGKRLKNDVLKDYQLIKDFEKIELEIVEQE